MFPPPDPETPADEYERRMAARRTEEQETVKLAVWAAGGLHGFALLALCAGAEFDAEPLGGIGLVAWCFSAIAAAVAGVATVRRWAVLSGWWIALGLLPWAVVASEISLPVLLLALYSI